MFRNLTSNGIFDRMVIRWFGLVSRRPKPARDQTKPPAEHPIKDYDRGQVLEHFSSRQLCSKCEVRHLVDGSAIVKQPSMLWPTRHMLRCCTWVLEQSQVIRKMIQNPTYVDCPRWLLFRLLGLVWMSFGLSETKAKHLETNRSKISAMFDLQDHATFLPGQVIASDHQTTLTLTALTSKDGFLARL